MPNFYSMPLIGHVFYKIIIMKNYFFIICFLSFGTAHSQTIFSNTTKKPISNATLISKTGQILGISNKEGNILDFNLIGNTQISSSDTIEIFHTNFETQELTWSNFKNNPILYLNPVQDIEEVVLNAKNPDFVVLKSYYISYQIIDNEPQSFSDGIIEYYISLSKNKIVDYNILESRIFKNVPLINEHYKKLGSTTLSVGSKIQPFNFHEEILLNRWGDFTFSKTNEIRLKKDFIGKIEKNENSSNIFVEYYTPSRIKEQRMLGLSSKITNYNVSEKFSELTPSIKSIVSLSKYYKSFISQKKIDFKYELIQNVQVLEKKFLTTDDFKKVKTDFNHSEKTKYSYVYWEQEGLISIPFSVINLLYNKLTIIN